MSEPPDMEGERTAARDHAMIADAR
jgi:hypothetical protein